MHLRQCFLKHTKCVYVCFSFDDKMGIRRKSGRSRVVLRMLTEKKGKRVTFCMMLSICRIHSMLKKEIVGIETHFQDEWEREMRRRKYNQIYIRLSRDTWAHSREQIQFLQFNWSSSRYRLLVVVHIHIFYFSRLHPFDWVSETKRKEGKRSNQYKFTFECRSNR